MDKYDELFTALDVAIGNGFDMFEMSSKKTPKKVVSHEVDGMTGIIRITYDDGSTAEGKLKPARFDTRRLLTKEFVKAYYNKTRYTEELNTMKRQRNLLAFIAKENDKLRAEGKL